MPSSCPPTRTPPTPPPWPTSPCRPPSSTARSPTRPDHPTDRATSSSSLLKQQHILLGSPSPARGRGGRGVRGSSYDQRPRHPALELRHPRCARRREPPRRR